MPVVQNVRVLVVDDEPTIADTLTMILKAGRYEARAVYSGLEAVTVLETFKPHAVISDVMMPGMTGIELAVHLADHWPICKLLLMSGHSDAFEQVERSLRNGYHHSILPKPVHPEQILAFVETCVTRDQAPAGEHEGLPGDW